MSAVQPAPAELPRALGLADSAAVVIGIVVGAGIFLAPRLVAQALPSAPMILAVWIVCGVLCFFGALAYAEVGAMMPETGGHYVYLRECYGPLAGFLCGWTFALVVLSAAMAWLAVSFSITLGYFLPLGAVVSKMIALALIAVLSMVNYRGIRLGAAVQKFFTVLKILGLAIIAGSALFGRGERAATDWSFSMAGFSWSAFGVAMIAVVLCYDGWPNISYVAGEVRDPRRNLPLALGLGLTAIIAIYTIANIAYLRVLPAAQMAATDRTGAAVAERTMGQAGGAILSITILLSIVGSINGFVITAPRICFAMARDGLMFEKFASIHPRYRTISFGIAAQAVWTGVLIVTGSFETLASYAMIAAWFFYGLTVAGVVILRRKYPDRARPYRMWGYPVTPWLFTAVAFWFVANTWITQPGPSTVAFLIILSGIPVYYIWRRAKARA
ncbi:MAG TPA: amino acid permease [Bryobacteraceae bacterium]|nr:amino acid permease [Bryobacteraceae bacterium]